MTSSAIRDYDEACMLLAIQESRKAAENGNMPFGACLASSNGTILLQAHNHCSASGKRGGGCGDVTRHAEMELIRMIGETELEEENDISECTIYASTEPCVMCAGAIYWSGVGRVVFGASSEQLETLSGPGGFDVPLETLYSIGRPGMRKISVVGPLLSKQAMQVHQDSGVWKGMSLSSVSQAAADIQVERSLFTSGIGAAASSNDYSVPVIDMSKGTDEELAEELWKAATTVGFFSLVNHGIPQETIDGAFQVSKQFFSLSLKEKQEASPFAPELNSGYECMSQVRPSTGTADQKESLQITAREGVMDSRWPDQPPEFQPVAEGLLDASYKLSKRIMDLLERKACPNLKPGTLSASHNLWKSDTQCTLRMLHYMPMSVETCKKLTTPDEEGRIHWRAGAHTDWDCITLLYQRPNQAGLECCSNPRTIQDEGGARWTPVDPIQGGIAVNIGDMLARWSNSRLYSNLHRVRMPTEQECGSSRYSIAFFAQADKAALIDSPGHEPITAGDYILSRVKSNFSK